MNAPGTPVIVLPAFAAPAFANARVPLGGVVTTFSLESTSPVDQSSVPFKFGQPFNEGDLLPTDGLYALAGSVSIPLQVDFKASHNDGSMRHAIISGIWPTLAAGEQVDISLVRTKSNAAAAVEVPALPVKAIATIAGVEYVASPAGDGILWLSGRFAVERIYNVPFMRDGVPHPDLTAQFCVRSYAGGAVKVDVTLEHTKAYSPTGDITYDAKIVIDGTVRYEQAGLVHFPYARWKKSFHIGHEPVHIKHNIDYLIGTKAVSNYDRRVKPSEKTLAGYAVELNGPTFAPMGNGPFQKAMGTAGGRPEIGLAPDSYAMTILSMDKHAKAMMLASADAGGSWGAHRRDDSTGPAAGRPIDIIHFPYGSLIGTLGDTKNRATGQSEKMPKPISSSKLDADTSHQPAFAYIPYLLTGDYYYLEELHFWSNYNLYSLLPGYRGFEKGWFKGGQVRGQAWTLRTLAEAGYITPDDHPAKASFHHWMQTNAESYNAFCLTGPNSNQLGIITSGYAVVYLGSTGIGPWQDDFFTSAAGHAVELGFECFKPMLDWKSKFQIGRMIDPGYCYTNAAIYALKVRDTPTSPFYESLGECLAKSIPPEEYNAPCGSQARADIRNAPQGKPTYTFKSNDISNSDEARNFSANYQPGLAYAVDSGHEGGKRAWRLFDERGTPNDYSTEPQFAIVPRTIRAAALPKPDPIVEPAPAPAPAPDPVPEPVPVPTPAPSPEPAPEPVEPVPPAAKTMTVSVSITAPDGKVTAFSFPVTAV